MFAKNNRGAVINEYLQTVLRLRGLVRVNAVTAARWLDAVGLLRDSRRRPGMPLRNFLRAEKVAGQLQEPNSRWYIEVDKGTR